MMSLNTEIKIPDFAGEAGTRDILAAVPPTKRTAQPHMFLAFISAFTIIASLVIMKCVALPFFWLWLAWATVFFGAMFVVRRDWPRAILFNVGIVLCLLAGAEAYLVRYEYTPPTISPGFNVRDEVLGLAPAKSTQGHSVERGPRGLFHGPRGQIFDVTYTIDSNGLRIAPPWHKEDSAGTLLFFGCSYTFGLGLNDNETLPYQVGAQSGGRYRISNFAFNGYSPAEMLAAIEHGMVRRAVDTPPRYAFYVAMPHHVWRVAGKISWGGFEPRYVLDANGMVHQAGYFEERQPLAVRFGLDRRVAAQLNKSVTWRILSNSDSRLTEDDVRLYFALVRRSQELLTAEYPGIQFQVILWPNAGANETTLQRSAHEELQQGFRRMGISVHKVEDILPGYKENEAKFTLSPVDSHPNALADRLLARYVLNEVGH